MNLATRRIRAFPCTSIACLRRALRLLPILLGFHLGVAVEPTIPARPEPWVKLPFTQWPQLVLANDATFNGHSPLLRGFSGAPVLGQSGFVVGVMTVWFEPRMVGDLHAEAGGEDAAGAFAGMTLEK